MVSRLMHQRTTRIVAWLPALLLMAMVASAQTTPPPADGVLLLRSGRVLAGKISRAGDRYLVTLPLGEIRVRADEVEMVGATLGHLYAAKRAIMGPASAEAHLDLATWCLTQKLWTEAQRELETAAQLEPRHPRLALLERRLAGDQQAATARPTTTPDTPSAAAKSLPAIDDSAGELVDLPKEAVETFTATVQPILNNHCSTTGCHSPTSTTSFRLARLPYGRPNFRVTQQNLRTVLKLVDRENPSQSLLLTSTIKPHGHSHEAVFKARDTAKYRQLVAWVQQVSGPSNATAGRGANGGAGSTSDARKETPPLLQPDQAELTPPSEPTKSSEPVHNPTIAPKRRLSVGPPGLLPLPAGEAKELSGRFEPRDALDPAIFNRRHFPNR